MKKFFSLVAIAAVAATMFTSCTKNDDPKPVGTPELSISIDPATIGVDKEATFTVTSNIAVPENIIVAVTSDKITSVTVTDPAVTIAKGTKSITGKVKGIAVGTANIKIAAAGVTIKVPEATITVSDTPAAAQIQKLTVEDAGWDDGDGYLVSTSDGAVSFNFFGFNNGVSMDFYSSVSKEMPMGMGELKIQGDTDAQTGIFLTPVAEGTAITLDAMVTSPWGYFETISNDDHKALATGTDVYIVVACGDGSATSAAYRAWFKINLGTEGTWSKFTVIEGYVCLTPEAEFKVGQKS